MNKNENLSTVLNSILSDPDPQLRVKLSKTLALGLRRVTMLPPVCLEQLVAACRYDLHQDHIEFDALLTMLPPEVKDLADHGESVANKTLAMLEAWLHVRSTFVAKFKELYPYMNDVIPE